jgi:hypothetical protein
MTAEETMQEMIDELVNACKQPADYYFQLSPKHTTHLKYDEDNRLEFNGIEIRVFEGQETILLCEK